MSRKRLELTAMSQSKVHANLAAREFENFDLFTLVLDSERLKSNPYRDSTRKHIPVMVPKGTQPAVGWPVVLMLSGFTGNGLQTFNVKSFEVGTPEILDQALGRGEAPRAIFAFCDGMTSWGGGQFIDSQGQGQHASYVLNEVCRDLEAHFEASADSNLWCVMGGSSGGYGALQLSTLADRFGVAVAIAPDSFFEASLLPEIRTALPMIRKIGGVAKVREELLQGRLSKRKEWHVILNAVAMGLCYAPLANGEPVWPIDADTGLVDVQTWSEWCKHDPLEFLKSRAARAKQVRFYLDAGDRDQFQLQYGSRQIRKLLKSLGASVTYVGFDGTHFDLAERRLPAWTWLSQTWRV